MGKQEKNKMRTYTPMKEQEAEVFHSTVPCVTYIPQGFALRQHYVEYFEGFRKHAQEQVKRIDGDHFNATYLDAEILAKTQQQLEHLEEQMATKADFVRRGIERRLIEDRRLLEESIDKAEAEYAENEKRISELKTILRKGTVYEELTTSGGAA